MLIWTKVTLNLSSRYISRISSLRMSCRELEGFVRFFRNVLLPPLFTCLCLKGQSKCWAFANAEINYGGNLSKCQQVPATSSRDRSINCFVYLRGYSICLLVGLSCRLFNKHCLCSAQPSERCDLSLWERASCWCDAPVCSPVEVSCRASSDTRQCHRCLMCLSHQSVTGSELQVI